jgi:MFS family permease
MGRVRAQGVRLHGRGGQLGTLALAFVAMLASGPGQSFLIAVFVDEMLAGTGLSRTAFSALYAAGTIVSALTMLWVGRLADRRGLRWLWVAASLGLAGACALASAAHGLVLAFLALAFLRTFGQGSFPLVGTLLVSTTFAGRRGQAMAVASLGLTAASVLLPPFAVWLVVEVGWRSAYLVLGLAVLVLVLPLAALARARPPRREAREEAGGAYPKALRRSRRLSRFSVPSPRASRLFFVIAAPSLILTAVIFHAVSLLGQRGLSFAHAGLALSVLGATNAVGTVAGGWISDRRRTRDLLTMMSGLLLAATALLLLPRSAVAFVAMVLLGLGGGLYSVVGRIVWPRTYGLAELGRLQGAATSVQIAGAAIGPLPLAVSEAVTGGYGAGLLALIAYAASALLVSWRWRDPRALRHRAASVRRP